MAAPRTSRLGTRRHLPPESKPRRYLDRLLDGQGKSQALTNSYLLKWEEVAAVTRQDVLKVSAELIKNSANPAKSFFAGSATASRTTTTIGLSLFLRLPKVNHTFAHCDENFRTEDFQGRDRRHDRRRARSAATRGATSKARSALTAQAATSHISSLEAQLADSQAKYFSLAAKASGTPAAKAPAAYIAENFDSLEALRALSSNPQPTQPDTNT